MVPNAILIPSLAAFTATIYARDLLKARPRMKAREYAGACILTHAFAKEAKERALQRARGTKEDRKRDGEVLLRFAKNADRGVIIYICRAARGPQAIRRHVDTGARFPPTT